MDPETKKHYRLNLEKDFFYISQIENTAVKKSVDEKIKIHYNIIKNLTWINTFVWYYKGEADQYRRRWFPQYLLAREASDYPCYVYQSELSKAFNRLSKIKLLVDISEYKEMIVDMDS